MHEDSVSKSFLIIHLNGSFWYWFLDPASLYVSKMFIWKVIQPWNSLSLFSTTFSQPCLWLKCFLNGWHWVCISILPVFGRSWMFSLWRWVPLIDARHCLFRNSFKEFTYLFIYILKVSLVTLGFDISGENWKTQNNNAKTPIQSLKALRTLRALRPLRAISRWQGMKVSHVCYTSVFCVVCTLP